MPRRNISPVTERPATIEDLADHKLIVYGEEAPTVLVDVNWLLTLGDKGGKKRLKPTLKVNNIYGTLLAVESGVGIAGLPDYIVQGHSRVTRIIPEVEGPAFDTFFVYPEELRHSKRVAIFRGLSCSKGSRERFRVSVWLGPLQRSLLARAADLRSASQTMQKTHSWSEHLGLPALFR